MLLGVSQEPSGILVHLHSGPKPPFCPMMHQATRANYPPNSPGRVLPEIKFGGGKCGKEKWRAGRCWQSSATIRLRPKRRPRAAQGASSCPGDPELPPAAGGASRSDGRAAPASLEPTHHPHPSSSHTSNGVVVAQRLTLEGTTTRLPVSEPEETRLRGATYPIVPLPEKWGTA